MLFKYCMKQILCFLFIYLTIQRNFKLNYNHSTSTIQLFMERSKPLTLQISFQTSDISLHESLRTHSLFLEKNSKYKLEKLELAKYDYKIRPGAVEEGALGVIGLQQSNIFFEVLRKTLNATDIKLEFRHKQGSINIMDEPCKYPLFPPLPVTLSEVSTHTFTINSFSTNFYPDSSFLKLIGKSKNPFEMTSAEMNQEITISIRDRIISVPFKEIVNCGKYQTSDSYECQLKTQQNADIGKILLYFDPIFCNSGVQLHRSIDDSWGFHYGHIFLLILQFFILIFLVKEDKVLSALNKFLKRGKGH